MENASRALLIAGGVLISILIISLIIYLNTSITSFTNSQEQKKAAQQLAEFNRSYEMYNKDVMYGIDVITVVNKAIEHNKKMDVSTEETPYYINIKIKVNQDFVTTGRKIDNKKRHDEKGYESDMTAEEINNRAKNGNDYGTNKETYGLKQSDEYYELGNWDRTGKLQMNVGVMHFFDQKVKDITEKGTGSDAHMTYYIYSGLTNFKRAVFKCTSVGYSDVTGRVNEMTFEQQDI